MTAHAVLNDESLAGGDAAEDDALLVGLGETFLALQRTVAVNDEHRVIAAIPATFDTLELPSRVLFRRALGGLSRRRDDPDRQDIAQKLHTIIDRARMFDAEGTPLVADLEVRAEVAFLPAEDAAPCVVPALRAAWLLRGLAWSADRPLWRSDRLDLHVHEPPGVPRRERLANAYRAELGEHQRAALARLGLVVLPAFDDQDRRHHPDHPAYVPGKSHIPRRAARILRYALPEEGGMTWWARCACNFYHRFMGSQQQPELGRVRVHWNGTTNPHATGNQPRRGVPTRDSDVPRELLELLVRQERTLADGECGCRERRGPGQA